MKLLTTNNTKTVKGEKRGFLTSILHLAPGVSAGRGNVCPKASPGCLAGCLHTAGFAQCIPTVIPLREERTHLFFDNPGVFLAILVGEIYAAIVKAGRANLTPVFRLNGTSDIEWENIPVNGHENIFSMFPDVEFYDYTKIPNRNVQGIKNYSLTFSRSETNDAEVKEAISNGMNIAVVFAGKFPESFYGLPVISGDEDDLRILDPKGVVIGLKAKGRARKDTSGFVVR